MCGGWLTMVASLFCCHGYCSDRYVLFDVLSFIVHTHLASPQWSHCTMRIMSIPTDIRTVAKETLLLQQLVEDFRIDAEVVIVTSDEVDVSDTDVDRFHKIRYVLSWQHNSL